MTIDERLERLAERHEALAQTVEMLSHEIAELKTSVVELAETSKRLVKATEANAENIRGLARIAEIHERRITRLEDGE